LASIVCAVATTVLLFDTNAVSVNAIAAGTLPPPLFPPPHAATVRAQAMLSCADTDARLVITRYKFIDALRRTMGSS
jgi:hypothetical protein